MVTQQASQQAFNTSPPPPHTQCSCHTSLSHGHYLSACISAGSLLICGSQKTHLADYQNPLSEESVARQRFFAHQILVTCRVREVLLVGGSIKHDLERKKRCLKKLLDEGGCRRFARRRFYCNLATSSNL